MQINIGGKYKFFLSDNKEITPTEKVKIVNELLEKELDFDGEAMTIQEYFRFTWEKEDNSSKNTMNNLAYYMSYYHRTEEELNLEEENKKSYMKSSSTGILTHNQEKEMSTGYYITKDEEGNPIKKRRYTNFVNLPTSDKGSLGVSQYLDNKDRSKNVAD